MSTKLPQINVLKLTSFDETSQTNDRISWLPGESGLRQQVDLLMDMWVTPDRREGPHAEHKNETQTSFCASLS